MTTRKVVKKGKAKKEQKAWDEHCDKLHEQRMTEMKPRVDTSIPGTILAGQLREAKPAAMRQGELILHFHHENHSNSPPRLPERQLARWKSISKTGR